jgi:hypothetical protein
MKITFDYYVKGGIGSKADPESAVLKEMDVRTDAIKADRTFPEMTLRLSDKRATVDVISGHVAGVALRVSVSSIGGGAEKEFKGFSSAVKAVNILSFRLGSGLQIDWSRPLRIETEDAAGKLSLRMR